VSLATAGSDQLIAARAAIPRIKNTLRFSMMSSCGCRQLPSSAGCYAEEQAKCCLWRWRQQSMTRVRGPEIPTKLERNFGERHI
jgi:hypothetical protein